MRFFGVRDSRISVLSKYIVNRLSEGSEVVLCKVLHLQCHKAVLTEPF